MTEQDLINILKKREFRRKDNLFKKVTGDIEHFVLIQDSMINIYGKEKQVTIIYDTGFINRPTLIEFSILLDIFLDNYNE